MRALFFGTPEIAVPALEALQQIAEVAAVVCQPDRPAGRGLALHAPPVKLRALELGLAVAQPRKVRTAEFAAWVAERQADVALVMAYGRILPPAVLAASARGFINLHASLLPRYRGAAPIQWALVCGETETGISLMQMDEGCDTGPVYAMHRLPIAADVTAGALGVELGRLAAEVVRHDLPRVMSDTLRPVPQDDALATSAPLLSKADGQLRWSEAARKVHDRARGMTPWPGACSWLAGKRVKLTQTRVAHPEGQHAAPGTILNVGPEGADVACATGVLRVVRAQLEGRRECSADELSRGRCLSVGQIFESRREDG
jgi:methionyl-tRNA formyltransferase